ncbi:MAG: GCN5-related N-acetyltransferase [Rickettsiaceae bacterium]|jgi:predicted acetyltransferase|nr:GCN5-related N-acetyltransferase [Rickettsiaceae bacterium]
MNVDVRLIPATLSDYPTIQNMGQFYVYDMSRFCGHLEGWECPEDGLYECFDFKHYFESLDKYPFLVKVNNELAGFVLINKTGSSKEVDWNIGEFFILAKFQGSVISKKVAFQIFDNFPGTWETAAMPDNTKAIGFWRKVVAEYTANNFTEAQKTIGPTEFHPKQYPMVVFRFTSK